MSESVSVQSSLKASEPIHPFDPASIGEGYTDELADRHICGLVELMERAELERVGLFRFWRLLRLDKREDEDSGTFAARRVHGSRGWVIYSHRRDIMAQRGYPKPKLLRLCHFPKGMFPCRISP